MTLVDHALLIYDERDDGAHRFRMLDTIHEFAIEEAEAHGEMEPLRRRMALAVVRLAAQAQRGMQGPEQQRWFRRLDADLETVRAVMAWTADGGDPALGADLAWYLWDRWLNRALLRESLMWVERLLRRLDAETAPIARVRALFVAAALASTLGEGPSRHAYLTESAALAKHHDYLPELASALGYLAIAGRDRMLACEATAIARRTRDRGILAIIVYFEKLVLSMLGDHEGADALVPECRALLEEVADAHLEADEAYYDAVYSDVPRGELARAHTRLEHALQIYRALGYPDAANQTLAQMARIAVAEGDVNQAAARYDEALSIAREVADVRVIVACLDGKAWVAQRRGVQLQGVRLWAAVTEWRRANPDSLPLVRRAYADDQAAVARAALGEETFAAARLEGQALALSEAIALAFGM
jgi:hypothetical protein